MISRGFTSSFTMRTSCFVASRTNSLRLSLVAKIVPLHVIAILHITIIKFIVFTVNITEQDPHVGHALFSISYNSSSDICPDLYAPTPSNTEVNEICLPEALTPASIGPPETNTEGTFVRAAAINIPGVILSQFG